jgi:hypothetical protein
MAASDWRKASEILLSEGYGVEDIAIKLKRMGLREDPQAILNGVRAHVQTLRDDGRLRAVLRRRRKRRAADVRAPLDT